MNDLMTVEEVGKYLRVGRNKAYEMVAMPGFPKVKVGRQIRVRKDWLNRWLEAQAGDQQEEVTL